MFKQTSSTIFSSNPKIAAIDPEHKLQAFSRALDLIFTSYNPSSNEIHSIAVRAENSPKE